MGRSIFRNHTAFLAFMIGALAALSLPIYMQVQPAFAAGAAHRQGSQGFTPSIFYARPLTATVQSYNLYLPSALYLYPEPLGDLTSGWYLMVDDGHIVSRDVPRQYHSFIKDPGNPLMRARKPWEGTAIQLYGTVFDGFRMWYSSYNKDWHYGQVLYAESDNGINWRRPEILGTSSNALFSGQQSNLISVMHTPHDVARPYKMVVYQNGAFWGYSSRDGIEASLTSLEPLWENGQDVAHFSWYPGDRLYYGTAKETEMVNGVRRRSIRFITSEDFVNWTPSPELYTPDALDDQISPGYFPHFYGMPVFGMGEQRLGLLWVLKAPDIFGLHGTVHVELVSSHDGVNWIREEAPRPPILDVGLPGTWDSGQVYTAGQPIKVGSELWLYYSGCNLEHGGRLSDMICSIGLAKIPYLRFASLYGVGSILTAAMFPEGDRLRLNYAAPQGEIRVELQRDGAPIPGYEAENCAPLSGDNLDSTVTWKDQAGLPEGPFQIKFLLQNASIYAFSLSG